MTLVIEPVWRDFASFDEYFCVKFSLGSNLKKSGMALAHEILRGLALSWTG